MSDNKTNHAKIISKPAAFKEGKKAYKKGIPVKDNPYDIYQESQDEKCHSWDCGWRSASQRMKEK